MCRKHVLKRFEMLLAVYPWWKHEAIMSGIWLCSRFFGLEITAYFSPPNKMLKMQKKPKIKQNKKPTFGLYLTSAKVLQTFQTLE